jgi:hypothetical protein
MKRQDGPAHRWRIKTAIVVTGRDLSLLWLFYSILNFMVRFSPVKVNISQR